MDEIIQGTPICMKHDCIYVCLDGVELYCPMCKMEEQEGKSKASKK